MQPNQNLLRKSTELTKNFSTTCVLCDKINESLSLHYLQISDITKNVISITVLSSSDIHLNHCCHIITEKLLCHDNIKNNTINTGSQRPTNTAPNKYKKLSYLRGTARYVASVEILPIATQTCRNYLYDKSWRNQSYEVGGLKWADE